jgi:hypothetical protein
VLGSQLRTAQAVGTKNRHAGKEREDSEYKVHRHASFMLHGRLTTLADDSIGKVQWLAHQGSCDWPRATLSRLEATV